jgi:6-phosphogluconate dehydrogenase
MGSNMVRRLLRAKHQVVVYDRNADAIKAMVKEGATGSTTLEDFGKAAACRKHNHRRRQFLF